MTMNVIERTQELGMLQGMLASFAIALVVSQAAAIGPARRANKLRIA